MGWSLRRLPVAWVRGLGAALGWVWHSGVPIRRSIVRGNLALAFPAWSRAQVRSVARANFQHYGRTLLEVVRAHSSAPSEGTMEGRAHLEGALAEGRGVLLLTAHLGAFERLVRAPEVCGTRLWVVTRRFRVASAQGAWGALRRGGAGLLPAGASARAALQALRRNEAVAFVLDQHDPSPKAVVAPFFGRPAATSRDLARLARLTGAPVVPVFTWWDGQRHRLKALPAVAWDRQAAEADEAGTRACLAVVEQAIRQHPEQWLWLHRRWKVDQGAGS
ncbi:MAG: hypothetical protein KC613_08355 [Myxococcales bacterium]|nr:hypothetical protein [Myxococcales bacterium]MCB9522349.1 hypothetical protein [Myxococcales bacterium]